MELCAIFPEGFRDFLNWNILLFNNKSIHIRSNVASCVVDKVINIFDLVKIKPEHSSCIVSRLRRTLQNNQLTLCFIRLRHLRSRTRSIAVVSKERGYCAVSNVLTSLIQFLLDVSPSLSPWIMIHINLNAHNCSKCVNCSYASSDVYCLDRRPCSDY